MYAATATERGSQDSNLEPPVLETGTLPLSYCPLVPIVPAGWEARARGIRACEDVRSAVEHCRCHALRFGVQPRQEAARCRAE
jgi:hypothetical protein